jgi:phosphate/sulfate permease
MLTAWLLIFIFALFGIVDLVVGVSNNAINFLNSALGSKVATRRTILIVASVGLVLGAFFSSGRMDLPRTGVIYPQAFVYYDLVAVFIAAMVIHIILLDTLNYFGIPTSTTTALVFELIGGGLAIAFVRSMDAQQGFHLGNYINTGQVFIILVGILLSVFLAFILGMVVQFLSRLLFTFNYRARLGWLFSMAAAFAFTVIIFLIIKKALHTNTFELGNWYHLLLANLPEFLMSVFIMVFFICLVAIKLFQVDVSRWVVVFGTFALAMSFASNDLANFIGIPLAMAENSSLAISSPAHVLNDLPSFLSSKTMVFSSGSYIFIFMLAAAVMSVTLFFSRKAMYVVDTQLLLERQRTGYERFEPTPLSRTIVRHFVRVVQVAKSIFPNRVIMAVEKRFVPHRQEQNETTADASYFDMIRASVNLTVASIMVMFGVWLRIPLSTTFIVFMVSMGTSLADFAWGRENAVYRLSGVFTILGTWLFASIAAVLGAFIITITIWYGGIVAIVLILLLTAWLLLKSSNYFSKLPKSSNDLTDEPQIQPDQLNWVTAQGTDHFRKPLLEASKVYFLTLQGFIDEDITTLKQAKKGASELAKQAQTSRDALFAHLKYTTDQSLEAFQYYVQVLDYVSELSMSLVAMSLPIYDHIHNNHKGLKSDQHTELQNLAEQTSSFFNLLIHIEKEQRFADLDDAIRQQQLLVALLDDLRKNQIKRIREGESKTKVSVLYMDVIAETKNVMLYAINIIKSHRDFVNAISSNM